MFALALPLQKMSSKRLQDVLVKTNIFFLAICVQDVFKTSCQDVFKTFSRRLEDVLQKRLQDIFKTSSRHFQDVLRTRLLNVFKTSSRRLEKRLQDIFKTSCKDILKTYYQLKLFLLTRLGEAFNTFLRRSFPKTVIYRGICPGNTTSDKFMVSVQNLQER